MSVTANNYQAISGSGRTIASYSVPTDAQYIVFVMGVDGWAQNETSIAAPSYNSSSASVLGTHNFSATSGRGLYVWTMDVKGDGAITDDIVFGSTGNINAHCAAFYLLGDNDITIGTPTSYDYDAASTASIGIDSSSGDLVVSVINWDFLLEADLTLDSGQTLIGVRDNDDGFNLLTGIYSQSGSASTTTSSFTRPSGDDYGIFGVAFSDGAGGGGTYQSIDPRKRGRIVHVA